MEEPRQRQHGGTLAQLLQLLAELNLLGCLPGMSDEACSLSHADKDQEEMDHKSEQLAQEEHRLAITINNPHTLGIKTEKRNVSL